MKKYTLILLVLIITAGLLAGCGTTASTKSTSPNQPMQRTIFVTGTGQVTLAPDIAYITIGVHSEAGMVAEALASNTQQAQAVSDALNKLGVDVKDIQTTAFNVYPQQNYGPNGEMLDIKYVVDNSVYVTVRELSKMGEILNTVVKSGANNINGIQFDVADRTQALSEARKKAVENARLQAEELATTAGAKLGEAQSINVNNYYVPYGPVSLKGDAVGVGGSVPVSAGQMTMTVDVSINYELK